MVSSLFSSFKAPGVRINETTKGYRSLEIASHQAVYMVGSGTKGDFFTPTQITSLTDFTNVFGSSPSENSVKLFFRNDKRGILYFVRTLPALQVEATITAAATGDYPLTIATSNGSATASYTFTAGNTTAQIASALITSINSSSISSTVTAVVGSTSNKIRIYMDDPSLPFLSVTSTSSNITIANALSVANDRRELIVTSAIPNRAYSLTFHATSTVISFSSGSNPTIRSIRDGLLAAINGSSAINTALQAVTGDSDGRLYINNLTTTTPIRVFVQASGDAMKVINASLDAPASIDYVYAIENSFDSEDKWTQGFLIAPQAFQLLTTQNDRISVGLAMEGLASDSLFDWVALVDAGSGLTAVQAKAEGSLYNSPQGHTGFYYPYVIDLEGYVVPPSAGVAGLATRRFKEEGIQQPPAGAKFPMLGVTEVVTKVSTQQQEELNPLGINIVRNLRNKGIVVWAMRTRSSSEFYTFLHTRVIMNVLNGSLREAFDNDLFSIVDGAGVLLNAISQTANALCTRLWKSGALFGATPEQAFTVICDFTNNLSDELERGNVILEIYAAPAPAMEKLLINTIRVTIGTLPQNQNQVATNDLKATVNTTAI